MGIEALIFVPEWLVNGFGVVALLIVIGLVADDRRVKREQALAEYQHAAAMDMNRLEQR